jgi:hypothetical protein
MGGGGRVGYPTGTQNANTGVCLHFAPAWAPLRSCARPAALTMPRPPNQTSGQQNLRSSGRLVCPKCPTRPDCAPPALRTCHRSITTAGFRHSTDLIGATKTPLNSPQAPNPTPLSSHRASQVGAFPVNLRTVLDLTSRANQRSNHENAI